MIFQIIFFTSVILFRLASVWCGASELGREEDWSCGIYDFSVTLRSSGGCGPGGPRLLGSSSEGGSPEPALSVLGTKRQKESPAISEDTCQKKSDVHDFLQPGTKTGLPTVQSFHDFSLMAHPLLCSPEPITVRGGGIDFSNEVAELWSAEALTKKDYSDLDTTGTMYDFCITKSPKVMKIKEELIPLDIHPVMGFPTISSATTKCIHDFTIIGPKEGLSNNVGPNLGKSETAHEECNGIQEINISRSQEMTMTRNNSRRFTIGGLDEAEASTTWNGGIYDFTIGVKLGSSEVISTTMAYEIRDFYYGDTRLGASEETPSVRSGMKGFFLDACPSFSCLEVATDRDGGIHDFSMTCPGLGAPNDMGVLRNSAQEGRYQLGASETTTAGGRSIHDFSIVGPRLEPTEVVADMKKGLIRQCSCIVVTLIELQSNIA